MVHLYYLDGNISETHSIYDHVFDPIGFEAEK